MKKFALILFCFFLMIISFGCKANVNEPENQVENQETPESPDPENQNPSNPSSPAAALVNQFFWGQWQRMDNGKSYYINENNIKTDERLYSATSSSENYLNVEGLGRFERQTDSVIINNSIPYFRKGGTNLSYKMKLVGFEDSINRAARAVSSASLSGYTITGTSEQFESFTSESVSDEDGTVTLTAPTSGDVQTITVTSGDDTIVVVPGIKVETDGSNMGTIPISQEGQYSLKVTGTIEDSEKDDGYLYGNNYKSYPMTLTITNVSDVVNAPSVCSIMPADSRVSVSSADGSDITGGVLISTLKSGFTKTILLSVTCGTLTESYLDTGLIVTVKNAATEKTWQDYVPLRFFKGLVPITVAAESVEENADAALNGFVIYPDGNSQFFSVPDKGDKTIYVPTFGSDQPYTLAFSGATIEGSLSNSTEMLYTVASGTWTKKEIDTAATAFIGAVQYGETGSGNGREDNATVADSEFEAYLADGDVDFYEIYFLETEIFRPDHKHYYTIKYVSKYGTPPVAKSIDEGFVISEADIPSLTYSSFTFLGWYIGDYKVQQGYKITSNIILTAKWEVGAVWPDLELNGGEFDEHIAGKYDETNGYFIPAIPVREDYNFAGWYKEADFSGAKIEKVPEYESTGDLTLYAKWEPILYSISYELNGGIFSSPPLTSYSCNYEDIMLPIPKRENNVFLGWYCDDVAYHSKTKYFILNDNDVGSISNTFSDTIRTDIKFYAVWKYENFEITADDIPSLDFSKLEDCIGSIHLLGGGVVSGFDIEITVRVTGEVSKENLRELQRKLSHEVPATHITYVDGVKTETSTTIIKDIEFSGLILDLSSTVGLISWERDFIFLNSFTKIILPNSLEKINSSSFSHCYNIEEFTIPSSVKTIGSYSVFPCSNSGIPCSMKSINFDDTSNWYISFLNKEKEYEEYLKNRIQIDVSNGEQNAIYFTSTYDGYYWYKE